MESIQQEILERIVRIETKIDGYNKLREKLDSTSRITDVQETKIENLSLKITNIEDNQKWLWRTFVAALIVGFIGAFVKWGG